MNELTPSHPASHPAPPLPSESRVPYAAFSASSAMNANNVVNIAADRIKSFQDIPRGSGSLKYQLHPQQVHQVNEYHPGPYGSASYSHLKDNRAISSNGGKFIYAPQNQPYPQQQSYGAPYGYPSYAQSYSTNTGDYSQHQHQSTQQQSAQQQYHGGYNQVGETNPLGMLVSSATNPQVPSDAMPHDPVNIGLKDAGDRKFRQSYGVMSSDSFINPSGGYVHGIERPGNVIQLKAASSSTQQQQQSMYQRSNMFGGNTAYYSQQQRTQEPNQQHSSLDLVPPSASIGASYDTNSNGANMGRSSGGMFSRMPQFASGTSLATRLKDGVEISSGAPSNGNHLLFMPQQQQSAAKSLEHTHPTSLYADVASSSTSMSMVSLSSDTASINANALYPPSISPPSGQLNLNGEDTCNLCSGAHSDRISSRCGHRFHSQCLHTWGSSTTCPLCAQNSNAISSFPPPLTNVNYGVGTENITGSVMSQSSTGQGQMSLNPGGTINNTTSSTGSNAMSNSVQGSTINNSTAVGGRPPPIDTRLGDTRMGATTLSDKRNTPSSRPGSTGSHVRKNKKLKDCSVPGCDRTVRSRGLCKGHGGGRRCGFAGCGLSDQGGGFCISHGGGKRCQQEGCENSAQSRGLCKLHGGGSRCTVPNCTKSSQGRGLCRAHGGGRRCMIEGCNKTDRRAGYCVTHGADKKCIIPECSKTGRIDNMCTKHYFERHPTQPPGTVSTISPPVITVNANTSAAKARAERKKAADQEATAGAYSGTSSRSVSTPTPPLDRRVSSVMNKTEPF